MQLHMTMEQRQPRVIRRKIDVHLLKPTQHRHVFDDARRRLARDPGQFESMPVQVHRVNIIRRIAHVQPVAFSLFQMKHRLHPNHIKSHPINGPPVETLIRRLVFRNGEEIRLTPAEYNLLTFLLQNPGRIISRDQILNSVWGYQSYPNTRTVDAHMVKLRQKLEPEPAVPRYLLTMHGFGYRFNP